MKSQSCIDRQVSAGLDLTEVRRDCVTEYHLTFRALPGETPAQLASRFLQTTRQYQYEVVKQDIFGSLNLQPAFLAAVEKELGPLAWPITWVEGACCGGMPLAGMHVFGIAGTKVETVKWHGRPLGRLFSDHGARHFIIGDLRPTDLKAPRTVQAAQVYQNLETGLLQGGMGISDLIRTWLFLDQILDWYGPFNEVRTEIFTQRRVFEHWVPASTGVGAANVCRAAMVAGAWAVQLLNGAVSVREVPSPMQCSASSYGSSFSRAIEMNSHGCSRLLISGTASIAPDGRSARRGDIRGQIDLTMEVVEAILSSCKMGWKDTTRASLYFRHPTDAHHFTHWCRDHGIVNMPALAVQSVVCRDELLFEIELDAMTAQAGAV